MENISLFLKTLIVGIAYVLTVITTAIFGKILGAVPPVNEFNFLEILVLLFVGGTLIASVMIPIQSIPVKSRERFLVNFLVIYMLSYLIGAPEIAIYTNYEINYQLFLLLEQFFVGFTIAFLITILFKPKEVNSKISVEIKRYFLSRGRKDWIFRFSLTSLLFPLIYFFFGYIFTPITASYYINSPLGLKIPEIGVIIPIEILRGFIYNLTFIPLLALLKMQILRLGFYFSLLLAVIGAIVPLMVAVTWPLELRFGHAIEMTLDSFAQGFMISLLLHKN
ncbi:MAG: hypothetical protein QXY19_04460 [Archaeoglobaceae archaeon]